MMTVKKTLKTWFKEKYPDKQLVVILRAKSIDGMAISNISAIFSAYISDKDVVEYTRQNAKDIVVEASLHNEDDSITQVRLSVKIEDVELVEMFTYLNTTIDIKKIENKLETTLVYICHRMDLAAKRKAREIMEANK